MLNDLMNRPFQAELVEGYHRLSLLSWEYHADRQGRSEKDYITFNFKHEHGESRNNMFEKDMSIFLSHVRRQLDQAEVTIDPKTFLKDLIDNGTTFDCWVKFEIKPTAAGLRRVRNLYFIEPLSATTENSAASAPVADDTELPPGV